MIHSSIHSRTTAATATNRRADAPAAGLPWIDSSAWRLPSGQALSEFALQAGFLAPHLFASDKRSPSIGSLAFARESGKRVG